MAVCVRARLRGAFTWLGSWSGALCSDPLRRLDPCVPADTDMPLPLCFDLERLDHVVSVLSREMCRIMSSGMREPAYIPNYASRSVRQNTPALKRHHRNLRFAITVVSSARHGCNLRRDFDFRIET